ncbi:hypothetical protein Tco_0121159 [Tanacetum coccineum]
MAEENHPVAVFVTPKFDMPHHRSKLTSTDVKSITKEYDISLDLHPRAPPKGRSMDRLSKNDIGKGVGGKIFHETFYGMKGWKDKFFFIDKRAIPDAIAWRHHDLDVFDLCSTMDYQAILVVKSPSRIYCRPSSPGYIRVSSLRLVLAHQYWEFHSVTLFFKDTRGNVITMSEYLHFLFTANVEIKKGVAIPTKIRPIVSEGWGWRMQRFSAKEKKKVQAAIAAAKKKESKKRTGGVEGSSKP